MRNAKHYRIITNLYCTSASYIRRFLGTLGTGRLVEVSEKWISTVTFNLDDINRYFTSLPQFDHQTKCRALRFLADPPRPNINSFQFSLVSPDDIKKIVLSTKSNAMGSDNINREHSYP